MRRQLCGAEPAECVLESPAAPEGSRVPGIESTLPRKEEQWTHPTRKSIA